MTLIQFLKSLQSFEPAYQDSRHRKDGTKVTRIKCFSKLSQKDFYKLKEKVKGITDIERCNNNFGWRSYSPFDRSYSEREVFAITIVNKTPSQITID